MPRGRRPFPGAREQQAIEALLRGDPAEEIANAVSVSPDSIWRLRRSLTPDQRAERARAVRTRLSRAAADGETIMAQSEAAVSRRIDKALRDDVVAEIYLAVL